MLVVTYLLIPFTYISYLATPTSSVEKSQDREIELLVDDVIFKFPGAEGAVISENVVAFTSEVLGAAALLFIALTI